MAWKGSGGIGPSKSASVVAAIVGLGMLATVVMFFVSPLAGVSAFVVLWVVALLAIIGFHVANAVSPRGVDHTRMNFEVTSSGSSTGEKPHAARLRELEQLRKDGIVSDAEYQSKRADILNEDW